MLEQVLAIVACPACKNELSFASEDLYCSHCEKEYPFEKKDGGGCLKMIEHGGYGNNESGFMEKVQNFWDSGWEKRIGEKEHTHHQLDREQLKAFFCPQKTVLKNKSFRGLLDNEVDYSSLNGKVGINVGSGPGDEVARLAYQGKSLCIPIDLSYQAITCAQQTLAKLDCKLPLAIQADARYLPIKSSSLDFYYSSGVLHHSPNIAQSIAEIHRVLKPGGVAYVGLYSNEDLHFLNILVKGMLRGKFTKKSLANYLGENTEQNWETGDKKNPLTNLYSKKECQKLFSHFSSVQVRKTGTTWVMIPKIGRLIEKMRPNFLPPGIAGVGGSNAIMARK